MNAASPAPGTSGRIYTDPAIRTLLISMIVQGMGWTVLVPLLAPIGRDMGLQEFQITCIIGASAITVTFTSPIWGNLSDRLGRKTILLVGLFGYALGTVVFNSALYAGMSGVATGWSLVGLLIVARLVHACLMSAVMPAANAYIADVTTPIDRARGMGAIGAANNLGSIMGPALAGVVIWSMLTPLWLMAGLALLNGLFALAFLKEPQKHANRPPPSRLKFRDPRIVPFVIIGVLMFSGMATVQQTMGFRFQDILGLDGPGTARTLGVAMMMMAAMSLVAQVTVVQRLHLPPFTLLRLALPLLILAFVLMTFGNSQWLLTLAMMIMGFGMGMAGPGFAAGASLAVRPEEQGSVAGIAGACGPLGFTIGPIVGGLLYQISPWLPYAAAAVVYAALLIAMGWLAAQVERHRIPEQEHTP